MSAPEGRHKDNRRKTGDAGGEKCECALMKGIYTLHY